MTHHAVLYLLYLFGFFHKGLPALIQTQHTVMVSVGNEACLNCRLVQSKDVLQVTWQKLSPEGERNVATFNKYYGQRVNADFRDKVEFKDAGLQNCSIVFRRVTEQDEGCYRCMFNTYPEGALKVSTCLRLYELHEPVLHVESNSAEEAVVSCSATGRPAPTVTLRVLQQDLHLSNYSSVSVTNTNSTVTVTSTAVLSGFHDDRTQVGCAVRVLSGPQKEVLMMIPEVKQSSADALKSDDGDHYFTWIIVLFVVLAFICLAVITVLFLRKRRHSSSHKDSEATKTPQKPTEHPHEQKTPLMQQVNEHVRQRMSTGKRHKRNSPKTSSPSVKCQLFPTNESI
ncbi:OX-2 membrane glycoprotein-like isoform X1 [Larimichthys crocea]|uniref:OX-2 membrane glycoprotein-like isoform X1 n=1 Tax=Larimichthys crocea TaxID=215358 RepID=UPI0009012288|nr:OX-2 membrane glycoprotein-like isoform X1 [Larimichthys crocea]